jgi:hypothetical protein
MLLDKHINKYILVGFGTNGKLENVMAVLTEKEAQELDDLLTNTIPEVNPNVEGHFIKNYRRGFFLFGKCIFS